jgi:hypothetical protein
LHLTRPSKWLTILIILTALVTSGLAAKPEEDWNRTYGGQYDDGAWSLQITNDGGYIIAGYTSSQGQASDLWLVKTDSRGIAQWNRTFGGSSEDVGYSVKQTLDGGYIVTGSAKSYGIGEERLWLLKTDSNGSKEWDRTFGGFVSSSGDGGWAVDLTKDGGYIVTGYTKSYGAGGKDDIWLIKTDSMGRKEWDRTFGGPKDDVGMSVIQAKDGGYVVTGKTASYGSGKDDAWLIKTNSAGSELWNKTFGGTEDDVGMQVLEMRGGYIITGRTESEGSGKKAFLLKTDLNGKKLWERVYGEDSVGISLQQTLDGGSLIAGYTDSKDSGRKALMVKADNSGKEQWNMHFGGPGQSMSTSVVESNDGECAFAGITNSFGAGAEDAWLVKVRPENIEPAYRKPVGSMTNKSTVSGNGTLGT